ncbi:MAG: VWA domain-containing protein [Candidatus Acidiferrales bacterium]
MPWLFIAVLSVFACTAALARAQDSQSSPNSSEPRLHHLEVPSTAGKITSQVKLVTVYATVRDKHGKIVPDLAKDDFALEEDGRPQTISHFVVQTDVPLTLGLLIDTSLSQSTVLPAEREASYTFLDHVLTAKDVAFVIHFDRQVELLQDLTSSRPKLQAALQLLQTPELNRDDNGDNGDGNGGDGGDQGHRDRGIGGGTHLYDAIWLASTQLMKKQQGRKAIFVLTDGVDRGSKESLTSAIEAAQRADTSVYTIYFIGAEEHQDRGSGRHGRWGGMGRPVGWPGGGGGGYPGGGGGYPGGGRGGNRYPREARVDGKKILLQISEQTGGIMFEVSEKLPLDQIYTVAQEGLRNQYGIGYTPNPPDNDPGYHTIRLTAKKKDLSVQARQGYYSGP